jgi:hypothetical protein
MKTFAWAPITWEDYLDLKMSPKQDKICLACSNWILDKYTKLDASKRRLFNHNVGAP